ncbi:MAG TPA: cyanophycinase [Planctomycetota bacterium]|nr:cyanophycinase [Planctomycetota bacterium]
MTRGFIVPIGGGIASVKDPTILRQFVQLCGGRRARIVVIPTASGDKSTGPGYEETLLELGVKRAVVVPFDTRVDCHREDWLALIEEADGVFITGGNQLRLATTLGGTRASTLLRERNADGMHIAGTSAGAAFVCEHMIAYGDEGATPHRRMVALSPGLGLTNRIIVDQHFRQRDRLGRLLTALAYNPFAIGVGLDEDTSVFIGPDDSLEVVGSGGVTIVDAHDLQYSSVDALKANEPISLLNIRLHILTRGDRYDLHARKASAGSAAATESR